MAGAQIRHKVEPKSAFFGFSKKMRFEFEPLFGESPEFFQDGSLTCKVGTRQVSPRPFFLAWQPFVVFAKILNPTGYGFGIAVFDGPPYDVILFLEGGYEVFKIPGVNDDMILKKCQEMASGVFYGDVTEISPWDYLFRLEKSDPGILFSEKRFSLFILLRDNDCFMGDIVIEVSHRVQELIQELHSFFFIHTDDERDQGCVVFSAYHDVCFSPRLPCGDNHLITL
jgi:hypothetical protein